MLAWLSTILTRISDWADKVAAFAAAGLAVLRAIKAFFQPAGSTG